MTAPVHRPDAHIAGRAVLVTGGLGFIGSNLALRLRAVGARVTIVDALIPEHGGDLRNLDPHRDDFRIESLDLRRGPPLRRLVRDQDLIFHLAGQVSHGDSMRDPEQDLGLNCVSTLNLVEACRHENPAAILVFSSTRQVYGRPRRLPVHEDDPVDPVDTNGIHKLAGEYYHILYHRTYDVRSVVLRLTNTYGPRQQLRNERQGVTSVLLFQALRGQRVRLFGDGTQRRDFNHVDDVVDALLLAATTPACYGQVLNLGAERPHSLNEFVAALSRHCRFEVEHVPFPDDRKLIDIGDYYGDWSRLRAATGWRPRLDLDAGMRQTVEFFRSHADVYLR
ncbi:MAG: NAD-dependent epimerase/dehydratase family protein [Planctomycetes bacterium]|nr:NAD-dependent epimerase/dehydratase family protein [Planctomycetota bacterium]